MSIQYAGGTIINATLTSVTGTRAELADWIQGRLVAAGWSSVTNAASDYDLTSATTPQSLSMRVRVYDPGAGNCARLKIKNATASKVQVGDCFLLPAVAKVWQIIANKYQYFIFVPGVVVTREFACGMALYVPSFNGVTEGICGGGNSSADTDISNKANLRLDLGWGRYNTDSSHNCIGIVNGVITEYNNNGSFLIGGLPGLVVPAFANSQNTTSPTGGYLTRWFNGSWMATEPLMAWGNLSTTEPKVTGQIWDGIFISDTLATDAIITYDGHTWQAITQANSGNAGGFNSQPGQLFIAIT